MCEKEAHYNLVIGGGGIRKADRVIVLNDINELCLRTHALSALEGVKGLLLHSLNLIVIFYLGSAKSFVALGLSRYTCLNNPDTQKSLLTKGVNKKANHKTRGSVTTQPFEPCACVRTQCACALPSVAL
jgi:hypothetical protein